MTTHKDNRATYSLAYSQGRGAALMDYQDGVVDYALLNHVPTNVFELGLRDGVLDFLRSMKICLHLF